MCQQDSSGMKKCSVKPTLGILEYLEDGGLGPDGLGSSSMGPLEDPTWVGFVLEGPFWKSKKTSLD